MATRVRSFAKINLGLAIGPTRPDGFHALATVYQIIGLHDFVTVSAKPAAQTSIKLTSTQAAVPNRRAQYGVAYGFRSAGGA